MNKRKAKYEELKRKGICVKCGVREAREGRVTCQHCADMDSEYYYEQRCQGKVKKCDEERKKQYRKRKRELCVAFGVCVMCFKRDATHGTMCIDCYIKDKRRHQLVSKGKAPKELRAELGLCTLCGEPALEGYKLCEKHLEVSRRNLAKANLARKPMSEHPWKKQDDINIRCRAIK